MYSCCSPCWRLSVTSWPLTVRTKEVLTPTSKLSSAPDSTKGNSSLGSGLSSKIRTSWNSIMHLGATWWRQVRNFSWNISTVQEQILEVIQTAKLDLVLDESMQFKPINFPFLSFQALTMHWKLSRGWICIPSTYQLTLLSNSSSKWMRHSKWKTQKYFYVYKMYLP